MKRLICRLVGHQPGYRVTYRAGASYSECSRCGHRSYDEPPNASCQVDKVEHDHPGLGHGFGCYTGVCPKCGICKFIGHGPLCWDCYTSSSTPETPTP